MNRLIATVATALLASGCSLQIFGKLSNLEDEAWVDTTTKPSTLPSRNYPVAIADGGSTNGARIVVVGQEPVGYVRISYERDGEGTLADTVFSDAVSPASNEPELTAAGDPVNFGRSNIAIGFATPPQSRVALVNADTGEYSNIDIVLGDAPAPTGIAFGFATGGDGAVDLVAVAGSAVFLVGDYQLNSTVAACPLAVAMGNTNAPPVTDVVVADLIPGGNQEMAAAIGDEVIVFDDSVVLASAGDPCFDAGRMPIARLPSQGASVLASGDFDGNGTIDLAVGRPNANAVDIFTSLGAAPITIATPPGSIRFGEQVAAGDFDGDGITELAVGDSGFASDGVNGSGVVRLYIGGNFTTSTDLSDSAPESDQAFGKKLGIATFDATQPLLVVGSDDEIFTYFRHPVGADVDVRVR